jgi:hypothetical protein
MSWIFIWYAHADYVDLTDTENFKWFLCIIKGSKHDALSIQALVEGLLNILGEKEKEKKIFHNKLNLQP